MPWCRIGTASSCRLWQSSDNLCTVILLHPMAANSPAASTGGRRRKTHNKSRNGCAQCKKRHYKVSLSFFLSLVPRPQLANMFASIYRRLCRSLCFQCDEIYPTCSNCKRLNSSCSLSASESPTDCEVVERQLNIEDLQLLHDWHSGRDTKFSDHDAEESLRQNRGREIDLGFQHPYGKFTYQRP